MSERDLELPRPRRLALTAGWNLTESVGLPLAAYAIGARLGGQDAGMVAATAVLWLTAPVRKLAALPAPVRTVLETAYGHATGDLFLFVAAVMVLCLIGMLCFTEVPLRETNMSDDPR